MKHTRGPWYVRQSIKGPYIAAGEGALFDTAIAKVLKARAPTGFGHVAEDHQQANARLMAAAPILKEILKNVLDACNQESANSLQHTLYRDVQQRAAQIIWEIENGA